MTNNDAGSIFVGVDVGASRTKVVVLDTEKKLLDRLTESADEAEKLATHYHTFQNPALWKLFLNLADDLDDLKTELERELKFARKEANDEK